MQQLGIKYQLRITMLLPLMIVAILFAIFYNWQFANDLTEQIEQQGQTYVRQLLPVAEYALLQNDRRTLQGLINASIANPEIKGIAFYSNNGHLLAFRGDRHLSHKHFSLDDEHLTEQITSTPVSPSSINFTAPIALPHINLYQNNQLYKQVLVENVITPLNVKSDEVLGWLTIDIDTRSTLLKQYRMVIITLFITLFGLLVGLIIHYFLANKIYQPISRIRRSMRQIMNNEMETTIKISSKGELGIIEQGCAHLQRCYLESIDELNQHVEIATADIQQSLESLEEKNIELSLDKKRADEQSLKKSEFIANMSHEIRTPMSGIIGFANVLKDTKLNPLQHDYVNTIQSSAENLLGIINDILDYSKIEAGKLKLDCIPFDFRHCLDEVLSLLNPNAQKKNLDIIPITNPAVPMKLLGDPLRIKQVLTNLIGNAIKFTDEGHVVVRTHVRQTKKNSCQLGISVTDTGIGLSKEQQNQLFNAFHQADTSTTRRYGGSGLGLVICRKLIEAMNGSIQLSSELNQGSTFSFTLELAPLSTHAAPQSGKQSLHHLKAVGYDPKPLQLESLSAALSTWGIATQTTSNKLKLYEIIKQDNHDFIFLSITNNDETFIEEISAANKNGLIVLLVNSFDETSFNSKAHYILPKPINMQKCYSLIENSLRQAHNPPALITDIESLGQQIKTAQLKILIAEDDPVNGFLYESLLKPYAELTWVTTGRQAIAQAEKIEFDLIFLDMEMPELNGTEVAESISLYSKLNRATPKLLISAHTNSFNAYQLKQLHLADCLQKPVSELTLLNLIIQHASKLRSQDTHARDKKPIDWPMCVQLASGKPQLAWDLLEKFIEELHKDYPKIQQSYQHNDVKKLHELLHRLHGACCFCGIPSLKQCAANYEQLLKQNPQAKHAEHYGQLTAIIEALFHHYQQLKQKKNVSINVTTFIEE